MGGTCRETAIRPPSFLKRGCVNIGKQRTHEEFVDLLSEKNKNIEVISRYTKAREKILVRCKICKNEWNVTPDSLLSGSGCPKCYYNKLSKIKTKTHEEFFNEMKNINPNIEVIGKYINARTKIKVMCKKDKHMWESTPDNLLNGCGCPKCAGKTITTKIFVEEMKNINKNIDIIGEYITNSTKIKCFCKEHKRFFFSTPNRLKRKQGCKDCKRDKIRKALSLNDYEFKERLGILFPFLDIISDYKNSHSKVLVKCKNCGNEFTIIPNNAFTRGVKCSCQNNNYLPLGELKIFNFLYDNNINFNFQKKFDLLCGINGGLLSYDFYLPDYNILIEYQGEQHQHPIDYFGGEEKFEIQQEHDKIKYEYAKNHNISLIEIWYWDFKNIDNILEDLLIRYKK